jgi:hypothetical protein
MTLSMTTFCIECHYAECRCAECHSSLIVMLNAILLSIVMLNVILRNVVMLNGVMLNGIMLSIVVLNVIMPCRGEAYTNVWRTAIAKIRLGRNVNERQTLYLISPSHKFTD